MAGYKEFLSGEVLNAEDLNDYLMDQVTLVFDSALARDNALSGYLTEGMKSYLKQNNQTYYYDGSAWQLDGPAFLTGYPQGTSITAPEYSGRVLMTTGTSSVPVWQAYPSHNYIINGAFDIWQRGTTFVSPGFQQYLADRFYFVQSGGGVTVTRQSLTNGDIEAIGYGQGEYYIRNTVTGSNTYIRNCQNVEDVRTLAGQTATVSFWVRSSVSTSGIVYFLQNFGSGGSGSTVNSGNFSITSSWQRVSVTVTIPSIAGKTIGANNRLEIYLHAIGVSDGTVDFWGVQLEAGSVATPFRRNANSLQGELAACQRYYVRYSAAAANYYIAGRGNASSTTAVVMQYPTLNEMRVTPTSLDYSNIAVYDEVTAPAVTAATLSSLANSKLLQATLTSSGLTQYRSYTTVSQGGSAGYIGFSAEL